MSTSVQRWLECVWVVNASTQMVTISASALRDSKCLEEAPRVLVGSENGKLERNQNQISLVSSCGQEVQESLRFTGCGHMITKSLNCSSLQISMSVRKSQTYVNRDVV